jgi:hypothetical protein
MHFIACPPATSEAGASRPKSLAGAIFMVYPQKYENCSTLENCRFEKSQELHESYVSDESQVSQPFCGQKVVKITRVARVARVTSVTSVLWTKSCKHRTSHTSHTIRVVRLARVARVTRVTSVTACCAQKGGFIHFYCIFNAQIPQIICC